MISYNPHIKRLMDIVLATLGLFLFLPLFAVIYILIRNESQGSPFFMQERIGKGLRPFQLIKFRSMTFEESQSECQFEPGNGSRVTRLGKILRKTKIDELPELFNIFKGDMSIAGPRPEVPKYVQFYPDDFDAILQVRPGLSDYASIRYRNEEEILSRQTAPDDYYRRVVLPDKLSLAGCYVENISFTTDWRIILETVRHIL